jgi:protease-4
MPSRSLLFVLAALLLAGCRHPVQVNTNSRVSSVVPVHLQANKIPVQVELADRPVVVETGSFPIKDASPLIEMVINGPEESTSSKIALVDIDGILLNKNAIGLSAAGENPVALFREKLDRIASDKSYRAVVLRINSSGGGVTACDIMRRDLMQFKETTGLPVIACLMDVSAGGAYLIATGADKIVAHPTTVLGGMGVILNLYNMEDALGMVNILGVPIKAGEKVDLGTPIRQLPEDSREILQDIADEFHALYRSTVLAARPQINAEQPDLFDGRVFSATNALQLGLVDQISYIDDALHSASAAANVENPSVVVLHRAKDPARTPYDVTPNSPAQRQLLPSISGLDRSYLPTFLYIWQPDPSIELSLGK